MVALAVGHVRVTVPKYSSSDRAGAEEVHRAGGWYGRYAGQTNWTVAVKRAWLRCGWPSASPLRLQTETETYSTSFGENDTQKKHSKPAVLKTVAGLMQSQEDRRTGDGKS